MAYRFFVTLENGLPVLSNEDTFHLTKVLRIRVGEKLELVANDTLYKCEVISVSPLTFKVMNEERLIKDTNPDITLLYALPKGDKLELVLQKAVEIGVNTVILVESDHCVTKFKANKKEAKLARLAKIMRSAAMQSKRNFIPELLGPFSFDDVIKLSFATKLIAHEKAVLPLKEVISNMKEVNSLGILVGPEGGFSEREVNKALNEGFTSISLGPNVLRSETAAIYVLSVLHHYKEG